jgi:hypothetical protein
VHCKVTVLLLGWRLREGGAGALITVARFSFRTIPIFFRTIPTDTPRPVLYPSPHHAGVLIGHQCGRDGECGMRKMPLTGDP